MDFNKEDSVLDEALRLCFERPSSEILDAFFFASVESSDDLEDWYAHHHGSD